MEIRLWRIDYVVWYTEFEAHTSYQSYVSILLAEITSKNMKCVSYILDCESELLVCLPSRCFMEMYIYCLP